MKKIRARIAYWHKCREMEDEVKKIKADYWDTVSTLKSTSFWLFVWLSACWGCYQSHPTENSEELEVLFTLALVAVSLIALFYVFKFICFFLDWLINHRFGASITSISRQFDALKKENASLEALASVCEQHHTAYSDLLACLNIPVENDFIDAYNWEAQGRAGEQPGLKLFTTALKNVEIFEHHQQERRRLLLSAWIEDYSNQTGINLAKTLNNSDKIALITESQTECGFLEEERKILLQKANKLIFEHNRIFSDPKKPVTCNLALWQAYKADLAEQIKELHHLVLKDDDIANPF